MMVASPFFWFPPFPPAGHLQGVFVGSSVKCPADPALACAKLPSVSAVDLDEVAPADSQHDNDHLLAIDDALTRLARHEPLRAELVKLHFFGGLTMPEAAVALGVSLATAERYWVFARAWLCAELTDTESSPPV